MTVRVLLFALARERAGKPEIEVELPTSATVLELRAALVSRLPELDSLCRAAMISVDEEYAEDATPIAPGSRLALIPPVSGGGPSR